MAKTFPFLELPPEIREKIYRLICYSPTPVNLTRSLSYPTFPRSLLLTSHQIYHEVRPLYFNMNTFSLTVWRANLCLKLVILSPSFRDNLRQIRTLRVTILRWGSKSFFVNVFLPALEDCILNGRLRMLEVRVRGQFLEGLRTGMKDGVGDGFENWRGVKRVLGDSYLDVGRLLTEKVGGISLKGGYIEDFEGKYLDDVTSLLWGWEDGK